MLVTHYHTQHHRGSASNSLQPEIEDETALLDLTSLIMDAQDDDAASDTSKNTEDLMRAEIDEYEANNPDFDQLTAAYGRRGDGQQAAIVSPLQASSSATRPLSVPRLHPPAYLPATPPVSQPAYLPAAPPVPQPPSSSTFNFAPSFTFTQELPSSEEIRYDLPAHQRPLPDGERRVIDNLSNGQRCHLLERWRPEIAAESRPVHRREFLAEMEEEKKAAEEKCEAEKARLRERAEKAENSASALLAEVESLKEKVKTLEQGSRAAFSKGEEKALAEHATRWRNMEEQLADDKKRLQIRQEKLDEEQKRLEGLARDQANAQAARIEALTTRVDAQEETIARHEETIARQTAEYDQLEKDGMAYVAKLETQLHDKEEEAKRVRAELVTETTRLQNQLGSLQNQLGHLQAQFGLQQLSHQAAMDGGVRE